MIEVGVAAVRVDFETEASGAAVLRPEQRQHAEVEDWRRILRLAGDIGRRASVTAFGEIEEFAQWVPVLVADATACNAFDRYTGALGFFRTLSTSFASGGAWTETTAEAMRGYKTADLDVVLGLLQRSSA